ncbi:MAG: tolC [Lacunisphaera sp.]|nr:tolC [Lacunisphaera sp.]MDB6165807.1 tolC [Lacunisphaera sp.]
MKLASSPFTSLGLALLLTSSPLLAQLNDGKPDPDFSVPAALDLPYALAFALDNNFAIRQAKERIRQQEGVVLEVKAAQIPNVSAAGDYQRNAVAVGPTGENRYWSFSITARQTLFAGGGIRATVKGQQLGLDAAVLTLQAVINDALLDVRTRFYTVLVDREKIKVQEQNSDLLRRQLQDVKNRYEAGTVSNFEVLRAEVALANAQTPLITARNDYRLAIEELRQALGFTNSSETDVTKIPEFVGTLEFTPASFDLRTALASAREQRPDLLRLEKLQAAAEQGVTARRADYYPDVGLFADYDWQKAAGSNNLPGDRHGWTAGLSSSWNIFDGRATAGRVAQARSQLEQAKLSVAEAQLAVDVDVRRAISTFQQATELAAASKKVVEQADEALRLANARYNAGTATQLDVLTSQVDLTTARLNQLQAYYSYNVAVATTRKAMGMTDELRPVGEVHYPVK